MLTRKKRRAKCMPKNVYRIDPWNGRNVLHRDDLAYDGVRT